MFGLAQLGAEHFKFNLQPWNFQPKTFHFGQVASLNFMTRIEISRDFFPFWTFSSIHLEYESKASRVEIVWDRILGLKNLGLKYTMTIRIYICIYGLQQWILHFVP